MKGEKVVSLLNREVVSLLNREVVSLLEWLLDVVGCGGIGAQQ